MPRPDLIVALLLLVLLESGCQCEAQRSRRQVVDLPDATLEAQSARELVAFRVDGHDGSAGCVHLFGQLDRALNQINNCTVDSDCTIVEGCNAANKHASTKMLKQLLNDGESTCKWMEAFRVCAYVLCDRGKCVPTRGDAGTRMKSPYLYDPEEDDFVRKRD